MNIQNLLEQLRAWLSNTNAPKPNLSDDDLCWADLSVANGNGKEVQTLHTPIWSPTIADGKIFIGCQRHSIASWFEFSDSEIDNMHTCALG